jgi:hypothetical protein
MPILGHSSEYDTVFVIIYLSGLLDYISDIDKSTGTFNVLNTDVSKAFYMMEFLPNFHKHCANGRVQYAEPDGGCGMCDKQR